jgi:hypothetical protein
MPFAAHPRLSEMLPRQEMNPYEGKARMRIPITLVASATASCAGLAAYGLYPAASSQGVEAIEVGGTVADNTSARSITQSG